MIRVIFQDGQEGEVDASRLDRLLEIGAVRSFWRRDGWVDPGSDPIRKNPLYVLGLPERRADMLELLAAGGSLPMNEHRIASLAAAFNHHASRL